MKYTFHRDILYQTVSRLVCFTFVNHHLDKVFSIEATHKHLYINKLRTNVKKSYMSDRKA